MTEFYTYFIKFNCKCLIYEKLLNSVSLIKEQNDQSVS